MTFVNEGWLRFTGHDACRGARLELGARRAPGGRRGDARLLAAGAGGRELWEHEYRLMSRSGEYRWIVDRGVPRYEGGRFAATSAPPSTSTSEASWSSSCARVYEREHTIAETLQRSLLPERLPQIDGGAVARYLPAGHGAAIGGDWYDALERPGRPRGADRGRRGRPRAARRGDDGPAAQRVPGLRAHRVLAGRGGGAREPAGHERRGRDGHGPLPRARPETGERVFSARGPPAAAPRAGRTALPRGRPLDADRRRRPGRVPRGDRVLPPGSTLLLYTDGLVERGGAARGPAQTSSRRPPARPAEDLSRTSATARWRRATPARSVDDVAAARRAAVGGQRPSDPAVAPAEPESLPCCGAGSSASCTPREWTSPSTTRSRLRPARRPATPSSTPTVRATRASTWRPGGRRARSTCGPRIGRDRRDEHRGVSRSSRGLG